MVSEAFRRWSLLAMSISLYACATTSTFTSDNDQGKSAYFDHAYDDHNRAPASFGPSEQVVNGSTIDPFYMRTQADYYYSMGEAQSHDGNSQKAIESFKMTLVYDPDSLKVRLRLATEHIKLGQINTAIEHCETVIKKDPKNEDARLLLGGMYSTLKVYPKAVENYEEILKIKPDQQEALLYLAAVYSEMKQPEKAIKLFESLLKKPDGIQSHLIHYYIGRVRLEQKEDKYIKAAEASFRKALEIKPDFVEAVLAIGGIYLQQKQEEKAITFYKNFQKDKGPQARIAEVLAQLYIQRENFDEAYEQFEILEVNSDDALGIKLKMALILIEKKLFDRATKKLEEILVEAPDSDKVRFYLAAVYEEMKQDEKAIQQFRKIPASSPFFSEAVIHGAYLMRGLGKTDEALDWIDTAIRSKKDVPQMYAMYASLLDEKGEYKKAAQILESALSQFPEHAQLHFYYGSVLDRLGQKEKVISTMKKVISFDPNHVQGLNYLAFTYAEKGENLDEAEKLARRAIELDPKDGYILDTLGWVLHKKGDYKESVKYLEAAQRLQPTVAVIAEHLGDSYLKLSLIEKASVMYKKAIDLETDSKKIEELNQKLSSIEKQAYPTQRTPASQR